MTVRLPALAARGAMLGTALLLVTAGPAAADPAGPTNYDSTVTGVEPAQMPIAVEVLGGDAFMVLSVEPGVAAEVPGYEGEPYLRFEADGTVLVNERSPARWLNDARYGELEVDLPAHADAQAEPVFAVVAGDGTYAWHDHRIHFMSPGLPSQVDPAAGGIQPVTEWEVPLVVDGEEVTVSGDLVWVPGPSPLVIGALVVLVLAVAALAALRRPGLAPPLVGVAAIAALVVALAQNSGLPSGSDAQPIPVVLAGIALGLLGLGMAIARRPVDDGRGRLITIAAGVPLLVWVVLHLGALTRPIVPGPLPTPTVRGAVLLAAAAGLASLAVLSRRALAATSLDPPEEPGPA